MLRPFIVLLCLSQGIIAAESAAIVHAREAIASPGGDQRFLLESALREAKQTERTVIFGMLADHQIPSIENLLDDGLNDSDPGVRAAAMGAVAKNWPTEPRHLAMLRREIDSPEEQVAQAALGAIASIGDDHEMVKILHRMDGGGPVAAQARATLTRLYGSDLGAETVTWRSAFDERQQQLAPLLKNAEQAFHGSDNEAIRAVLHQLLMLRNPPRSDVADVIARLLTHPDPDIARLAREGLGNLSGGIARLALKSGGSILGDQFTAIGKPNLDPIQKPSHQEPAADHSTAYVLTALGCFFLVIVWMLFRTPLKDTKPIREVTRAFKRRRIQATRAYKKL